MSMKEEFKAFITKGDVVSLAVAVVVGAAFGKIVTAMVSGLIMPLVSYVMPTGDWQAWELGRLKIGSVLGATVDFLIISLVVFLVLVKGLGRFLKKDEPPPAPSKQCPYCLEAVAPLATRCKFCTSTL